MLIGIAGCKQSGKDTICKIIQANDIYTRFFQDMYFKTDRLSFILDCLKDPKVFTKWNLVFPSIWKKHAFADNLKRCLNIITGMSIENFESERFKNSKSTLIKDGHIWTYRELLQQLGTNVCRTIDDNLWIKSLFRTYSEDKNWIITDVRYENEANSIKAKNGILIKVIREEPTNEHSSETGLLNYDHFDHIIENKGTLEELILKIVDIV